MHFSIEDFLDEKTKQPEPTSKDVASKSNGDKQTATIKSDSGSKRTNPKEEDK